MLGHASPVAHLDTKIKGHMNKNDKRHHQTSDSVILSDEDANGDPNHPWSVSELLMCLDWGVGLK